MNIPHFAHEQHKADENPNTKCNFKISSNVEKTAIITIASTSLIISVEQLLKITGFPF